MPYDCFFSHNFSFQVKVSAADRSTSPVTGSIIAVTSDPAKQTICIEGPTATPQLPKGPGFLVGVSISKPAFCTLNDLSQNARRGMSSLRRVEDCFPYLIARIAASIAPLRVTPQPASSYGLHGADPGSAPFSPVTPPRVTLYAKLYLQQWRQGREEYQIRGRTEARRPTTLPAGRSRLR
jgi:hypothetical protein